MKYNGNRPAISTGIQNTASLAFIIQQYKKLKVENLFFRLCCSNYQLSRTILNSTDTNTFSSGFNITHQQDVLPTSFRSVKTVSKFY